MRFVYRTGGRGFKPLAHYALKCTVQQMNTSFEQYLIVNYSETLFWRTLSPSLILVKFFQLVLISYISRHFIIIKFFDKSL